MTSMRTAVILAFALQIAAPPHHVQSPVVHFFFHLGVVGLLLVSIVDSSFVPLPIPGVMGMSFAAAHSMDSLDRLTGIQTGGCGCCTGRGQIATSL